MKHILKYTEMSLSLHDVFHVVKLLHYIIVYLLNTKLPTIRCELYLIKVPRKILIPALSTFGIT